MERNTVLGIVWLVMAVTLSMFLVMGLSGDFSPLAAIGGDRLFSWIFY